MKNAFAQVVAPALLLTLTACQPASVAEPVDTSADEAAIRHVLDEIVRTFNAGDYDAMFALYEDDVRVYPPGAPEIGSKTAWREALATGLPGDLTLRMRFDTEELVVDGDLAYERGTYHVEAAPLGTNAMVPLTTARHIHIFRRQADGEWKGWRLFESNSEATPATLPTQ
jgi:ketosteroid isomerase-like protein